MLEIKNLSKKYKNSDRYSVEKLSFKVNDGEIFGFLGLNGAGKSTTIKCLTGILPFREGQILIDGHDIQKDPIGAKLNIGYVPDDHAVYDNLTGREYAIFMGNVYGVNEIEMRDRINKFAKAFSMTPFLDRQIKSYSHGMKQKICIIAALIHNPHLWVLDEPYMGLDVKSIEELRGQMIEHKNLGNIVFFSTHNIDMAEKLCDRVGIMNKGKLLEIVDMHEFKKTGKSLEKHFFDLIKE